LIARIIRWSLVTIAVIVVGGVALLHTSFVRTRALDSIEASLRESMRGDVTVGSMEGILLHRVTLRDVRIEDEDGRPVVEVEAVQLVPDVRSLLFDRVIHLKSALLVAPRIHLTTDKTGKLNLSELFIAKTTGPKKKKTGFTSIPIDLENVRIRDGFVSYAPYGSQEQSASGIDLTMSATVRADRIDAALLELGMDPSVYASRIALSGRATVDGKSVSLHNVAFSDRLGSSGSVASATHEYGTGRTRGDYEVHLDPRSLRAATGQKALRGTVELAGAIVHASRDARWEISGRGRLNESAVAIEARASPNFDKVGIDAEVTGKIDPAELWEGAPKGPLEGRISAAFDDVDPVRATGRAKIELSGKITPAQGEAIDVRRFVLTADAKRGKWKARTKASARGISLDADFAGDAAAFTAHANASASNLRSGAFFLGRGRASLRLAGSFEQPHGAVEVTLAKMSSGTLRLGDARVKLWGPKQQPWHLEIVTDGAEHVPHAELAAHGHLDPKRVRLTIDRLRIDALEREWRSRSTAIFEANAGEEGWRIAIEDLALGSPAGSLALSARADLGQARLESAELAIEKLDLSRVRALIRETETGPMRTAEITSLRNPKRSSSSLRPSERCAQANVASAVSEGTVSLILLVAGRRAHVEASVDGPRIGHIDVAGDAKLPVRSLEMARYQKLGAQALDGARAKLADLDPDALASALGFESPVHGRVDGTIEVAKAARDLSAHLAVTNGRVEGLEEIAFTATIDKRMKGALESKLLGTMKGRRVLDADLTAAIPIERVHREGVAAIWKTDATVLALLDHLPLSALGVEPMKTGARGIGPKRPPAPKAEVADRRHTRRSLVEPRGSDVELAERESNVPLAERRSDVPLAERRSDRANPERPQIVEREQEVPAVEPSARPQTVTGTLKLTKRGDALDLDVEADVDRLQWNRRWPELDVKLDARLHQRALLATATIDGDEAGAMAVTARALAPEEPWLFAAWQKVGLDALKSAEIRVKNADLAAWGGVLEMKPLAGQLDARVDLARGGRRIEGTIALHRVLLPQWTTPLDAQADLRSTARRTEANVELFSADDRFLTFEASVPRDAVQLAQTSTAAIAKLPLEGRLRAEKFPMVLISQLVRAGNDASGSISIDGRLSGSFADPLFDVTLSSRDARIRTADFSKIEGRTELTRSRLVSKMRMEQKDGGELDIDAKLGLVRDAAIDGHVRAKSFDLGFLSLIAPTTKGTLGGVAGTLDSDLVLSGSRREPHFEGEAKIHGLRAVMTYPIPPVEKTDVELRFAGDEVNFGIDGHSGKGTFQLNGQGVLPTLNKPRMSGALKMDDLSIAAGPRLIETDVEAEWNIKTLDTTIEANVVITDGDAKLESGAEERLPIKGFGDVVLVEELGVREDREQVEVHQTAPLQNLRLTVRTDGTIPLHSEEIDASVDVDLVVETTRAGPIARGSINVENGTVVLFGDRRWSIERAEILFPGLAKEEPRIGIRLFHDFSEVVVYVDVLGVPSEPELRLTSDPGVYSREQLLGFVLGGDPNAAPSDAKLSDRASGFAAGFVVGQIQAKLKDKIPIDTLKVDIEDGARASAVTVGKWITERVFLAYNYRIEADEDENASEGIMRIIFGHGWVMEAAYGDRGNGAADLLWIARF
jgi:hypothetical protein